MKNIVEIEDVIRDEYCPRGYVFLTNHSYGVHVLKNAIEEYQEFIEKLKSNGYLIQVAEAFDIKGIPFSNPTYQHLAIYIRRQDGLKIKKADVWRTLDKMKKKSY